MLCCLESSKYYPKWVFLDVNLGHNPSLVWGSIHASQVVVRGGMRWRVGNGRKINLWHDLWLPDPSIFFVTSSPVLGTEHFCVADLVDDRTKHWNLELAGNLLQQRDLGDDALVWSLAKDGRFSVRSAYFYIMEVLMEIAHPE